MQLKKERNSKNGKNIIRINQNIAADYQNIKETRQIESVYKNIKPALKH